METKQFSFGDRVHVAFPDPFEGTITGSAEHDETLWEVAAPIEWCVRNNNAARIQFVRAPFLTKIAAPMSAAEAGRRGGQANIAKHGPEFYREIGRKGGLATKREHGRAHYEAIGAKGGNTVKKRGHGYYEELGRKGGAKVKALIAAGKAAAPGVDVEAAS